ncbi:hypothetical protein MMB232_01138 [Brevundimonas subvibrioides]
MTDQHDKATTELIQRWIVAFCEMPVLIDPDLMRAVLDDRPRPGETQ